jgi:DNA repair protein RecO (recombination protein O)
MGIYKATAIVLRRIPLKETDKIVTLYTRELGKLAAVAKGARRTTSKLAGATEPLMLWKGTLSEGTNLDVVSQCEIKESFTLLKSDYGRYLRATYLCELLDKLTEERDPDAAFFDLLLSALYILQRALQPDATVHAFELKILSHVGYEPRLDACIRCDAFLEDSNPPIGYSASRGGAVCESCRDMAREDLLPLSLATLLQMQTLFQMDNARAIAVLDLPAEQLSQINRLIRAHLKFRLERPLKTLADLDAWRLQEGATAH